MIIIYFVDMHNFIYLIWERAMCDQVAKKMIKMFAVKFIVAFLLFVQVLFNTADIAAYSEKPIHVHVSIEPQITFVERIGGDRVSVHALLPPGESPATYSPTPGQMVLLTKSKLFFRTGVPFEEPLIKRIRDLATQIHIVDVRDGIVLRKMERDHDESDTQDLHSSENGHSGYDPHIWLSPVLVQKQATTICEALIAIDPSGRQTYEAKCRAFIKDLEILHQKLKESLSPFKGGTFFVFHPSFGYFADAYGLKQMAIQVEGKAPKGKDLSQFIKKAKDEKVRVVFVQPQFDQNTANKIAIAINGVVVILDPLSRNYFENMKAITDQITKSMKR